MKTIILGTAHLKSTPGKCSPDKKIREYAYSREIVDSIYKTLKDLGYKVFIDIREDDLKVTTSQELVKRCKIVNDLHK
jgi:N-acetylmuramoyl-L-alanine amidase